MGRERPRVHRLPARLGPDVPRPRAPGRRRARSPSSSSDGSTYFLVNEPAIRLADEVCRAVPCARAGPLHLDRLRGDVLRAAGGARLPQARQDHEVRGRLPRQPRLRADVADAEVAQGVSRRRCPTPPASRTRSRARCSSRPTTTWPPSRRCSRSTPTSLAAVIVEPFQRLIPPAPGFLAGPARAHAAPRDPADLRRGGHRLPLRVRRRPGVLRRHAGPGHLRQDRRRRLPAGRRRAAARTIMRGFDPRLDGSADYVVPGRHAERQSRSPRWPGSPRWPSCASPASTSACARSAARSWPASPTWCRTTGVVAQVVGEPSVFDIVFTDRPVVDYRATLTGDSAKLRRFNEVCLQRGAAEGRQQDLRLGRARRGGRRAHAGGVQGRAGGCRATLAARRPSSAHGLFLQNACRSSVQIFRPSGTGP